MELLSDSQVMEVSGGNDVINTFLVFAGIFSILTILTYGLEPFKPCEKLNPFETSDPCKLRVCQIEREFIEEWAEFCRGK